MLTETPENYAKQHEPIDDSRPLIKTFARKITVALGIFAAFAALAIVLWQGTEVFLLIFAGLLLAIFLRSLSDFLSEHTPLSDKWALTIVLLGIVAAITLGFWFLSDSVERQFVELSENLPAAFEQLRGQIARYPLGRRVVEQIPPPSQIILGGGGRANVFARVTGIFSTALDAAVNVLIVLITAVYFAFNPKLYREGTVNLVPKAHEKRAREIISTVEYTLRRFLLGISGSMAINGALTFLGLWFLGVPFAIPLDILAGLLTFIPNIGPFIAGLPAVLIAFSNSPAQALYVLILYLVVQNLDGFIISPLIQQRAVSLPPVLVIGSQLLLAVLFGFFGLLLAVPLVAAGFVLVKMIYVEDILGRRIEVKGEPEAKVEIRKEALDND
ncbi:MAG TPA: AI-2E family transporter [Pyrinomonadaceae bacterium]|nr:AI-2E family transporter [Pyrinomonadaceae bacterium]